MSESADLSADAGPSCSPVVVTQILKEFQMRMSMSSVLLTAAVGASALSWSQVARGQTANTLFPSLATLSESNGGFDDNFGFSVAVDGNTMVVGVPNDEVGTNTDQGSVRVYVRSGSTWALQATLTASDGSNFDDFGSSVAIDGDTIAVGVPFDDVGTNSDQGSVRVFTRIGSTWTALPALTATDGAAGDGFGSSVAIEGDTMVVGVPTDGVGANANQGSARVYVRTGSTWALQATLTASDGAQGDQFGRSVVIDGNTIAVGVPADDVGANPDQGSVRVFTGNSSGWTPQATLTAADGAGSDFFGTAVALDGNTLAVGVPRDDSPATDQGSVRVFVRAGTVWTPQAALTVSDGASDTFDRLGDALAISGDMIVAGAAFDEVGNASQQGTVRVFVRVGTDWTLRATLTAADGAAAELFGSSVAVDGDVIAVGVESDEIGIIMNQGSVRVFGNYRAFNQTTGAYSSSLASAIGGAAVGNALVVDDAAFAQASGIIDASQKRLTFVGLQPLTLGAGALMTVASNSVFMRSPEVASAGLTVAGKLTAPQNGTLTFEGLSVASGGQFMQRNSTILVNGTLATASGGVSYLQGQILAEGVTTAAGAQHRVWGDTDVLSNYTNAGTTVVQRGILYIYGTLTNTGTMTGQVNNGVLPPSPGDGYAIGGDYAVEADASLTLPDPAWWLRVGGSLDIAIDDPARFDMGVATIEMSGTGEVQSLEVFGRNLGAVDSGFAATNYLVGALRIRAGASVELADNHDNAPGKGGEAIYTNALVVPKGASLATNGRKVYTRSATIAGSVSEPSDIVVVGGGDGCPADLFPDGAVNAADLSTLLVNWGPCTDSCVADLDGDGVVGATDLAALLASWGACPQS